MNTEQIPRAALAHFRALSHDEQCAAIDAAAERAAGGRPMTCTLDTLRSAAEAAGWDYHTHPAPDGVTVVHVYGPVSVARLHVSAWAVQIWDSPNTGYASNPEAGSPLKYALHAAYAELDSLRVRAHVRPVLQAAGALPVSLDLVADIDELRSWALEPHVGCAREEVLELVDRIRWAFEDLA